ncbi:thiamine diphosphokinase [Mollicutes bacterium LVI A0039]|nr:thiamine diphosphokinase [Mollicutes bacterium LVI A0039]
MTFLKSRAVVVLAGAIDVDLNEYITAEDYVIAVDGGLDHLERFGTTADILIGDLDSVATSYPGEVKQFDPVKDDTDFKCSLDYIQANNIASTIVVFGFASLNRIDHVFANIANIIPNVTFISNNQQITLIDQDTVFEQDEYRYYSFFALEVIDEFSLVGFKYPLDMYCLHPLDPLCISNELEQKTGKIKISNGSLIVIKSLDN